ncbi:LCP family protein [uncultured Jatrophihabitans sp.]|uniref:LCP family protein n=1 Tax=uncultured Jatrophihabitans sp. TaxID=1610747 RepID=UPI0035CB0468
MPSGPGSNAGLPLPPHLDPRGRHRGGRSFHSGAGRVALSVMALISVGLLVLAGYLWYTIRDINNGVARVDVAVGAQPSDSVKANGKDQNILLVGNDDRTNMTDQEVRQLKVGRDGGSLATDTMMIVHVPANGSRATLISLPRDSYVKIAGWGMGRLNGAYADAYGDAKGDLQAKRSAGAALLIDTISNLTGLTINHYVQIDLLGFYRLSEALGGVPVNLCENVDDTVAYNESHGEGVAGSGLKLSKGKHVLQGLQALEFVRQRHNLPRGDLDRVRRQQYFLTAAFRQVESVGVLTKLHALGSAIKRSISADPGLDLLDLGEQLEGLSANNISGKTIPTTAGYVNGQDVLIVDPAKVRRFVEKVINPPASTPSTSTSAGTSLSPSKTPKPIDSKCIN